MVAYLGIHNKLQIVTYSRFKFNFGTIYRISTSTFYENLPYLSFQKEKQPLQ